MIRFALFVLLNILLIVHPDHLYEELAGMRLYLVLISLCLLLNAPQIVEQLSPKALIDNPISVYVILLIGAIFLSLLLRGMVSSAVDFSLEFAKVVLYYFLFLAVVDNPAKFRWFLICFLGMIIFNTALSVAQFHEYVDFEAIRPLLQREYDRETGQSYITKRIVSTGIFNDPNDMCLLLTAGMMICTMLAITSPYMLLKPFWLIPIPLFGYAFALTQSRGGMLGLFAGVAALGIAWLGPRRGPIVAAICIPILLLVFAGRQTNFSLASSDTSQQRMQLWSEGIQELIRRNPITGIGHGQFHEEFYYVAHNTFVEAYVETGILGGGLFFGAFFYAYRGLRRTSKDPMFYAMPRVFRRMHPFVIALLLGYLAGCYTVTRTFVIPTYMMLGIATSYARMSRSYIPNDEKLSPYLFVHTAVIGVCGLVFLKLFTMTFVSYR